MAQKLISTCEYCKTPIVLVSGKVGSQIWYTEHEDPFCHSRPGSFRHTPFDDEETDDLETKNCNITWYHTAHTWNDGTTRYSCPGIWPHPLPPDNK